MKSVIAWILLLSVLATFQTSFLNILLPDAGAIPVILFVFAIVFSLSRGFDRALAPTIWLGALTDIVSFQHLGFGIAFSVGLSYTARFLSRRLFIEHPAMTMISVAALLFVAGVIAPALSDAVFVHEVGTPREYIVQSFWNAILGAVVLFPVAWKIMQWFERRLSYLEAGQKF